MLKFIFGFLPWIIYFALVGNPASQSNIAVITALVMTFLFNYKELRKGFILSWGTLLFFTILLISSYIFKNNWLDNHANFLSNIALAFIVWFSLFIGKPFTLQYARERVPAIYWQMPGFIYVNKVITSVWGIALLLGAALSALQLNSGVTQLFSYAPNIFALWFTIRFPNWYRARALEKKRQANRDKPNHFLSGNYAPLQDELTATKLSVTGEIPAELNGVYMRNGPNPAFPPISYTYPFDGDGMLHAIYLDNGTAAYRNRYVETKGLLAERKAGWAIYGGITMPTPVDTKLVGKNSDPEQKITQYFLIARLFLI